MTIRNETERAAAAAKMEEMIFTSRQGRQLTDDEQREFDLLASDVTEFDTRPAAKNAPPVASPSPPPVAAPTTPPALQAQGKIDAQHAAEVVRVCEAGGAMHLAAGLLLEGVSVAEARERVGTIGTLREMVAMGHRISPTVIPADLAATYLAENRSVQAARADMFERMVAAEEKTSINSHLPAAKGNAGHAASIASMERELRRVGRAEPKSP